MQRLSHEDSVSVARLQPVVGDGSGGAIADGLTQRNVIDEPVPKQLLIDEGHRHMVGELGPDSFVCVDVETAPANTQLLAGRPDGRLGFHTQVAAGARQEEDPRGWEHYYLPARRR